MITIENRHEYQRRASAGSLVWPDLFSSPVPQPARSLDKPVIQLYFHYGKTSANYFQSTPVKFGAATKPRLFTFSSFKRNIITESAP